MSEDSFSVELVDRVATALMRAMHGDELPAVHPFAPSWKAAKADAHVALEALAAAGLLLPEGAKHRTELMLNWYFAGGRPLLPWGVGESEPEPLERLREMAYAPPVGAIGGEIVQRDSWVGRWSVVEPVAIQGAES